MMLTAPPSPHAPSPFQSPRCSNAPRPQTSLCCDALTRLGNGVALVASDGQGGQLAGMGLPIGHPTARLAGRQSMPQTAGFRRRRSLSSGVAPLIPSDLIGIGVDVVITIAGEKLRREFDRRQAHELGVIVRRTGAHIAQLGDNPIATRPQLFQDRHGITQAVGTSVASRHCLPRGLRASVVVRS